MVDKFLSDPDRPRSLVEQWAIEKGLPIEQVGDFFVISEQIREITIEKRTVAEQEESDINIVEKYSENRKNLMGNQLKVKKRGYLRELRCNRDLQRELYNHRDFRNRKRNLEALDYLIDNLKLKDSYKIRSEEQLEALESKYGEKLYLVYRFINKKTGLERHGETEAVPTLKNRIKSYISKSETSSGAFYEDIYKALAIKDLIKKHETMSAEDLISEFFEMYEVEIWICKDQLEMDALEIFNTLYYNRAEKSGILSDLTVNNYFNPVYGNSVWRKSAIESAGDMLEYFEQSLSGEEVLKLTNLKNIQYINRRYVSKFFDGKIEYNIEDGRKVRIKANTYNEALKQYTIAASKMRSDTDGTYIRDNDIYIKEDLIWTVRGPEGRIIGLFYGIGNGLSKSFFEHKKDFNNWIRTPMTRNAEITMPKVSEIVYSIIKTAMQNNEFSGKDNHYKFEGLYNNMEIEFEIVLDSNNRIIEIIPM